MSLKDKGLMLYMDYSAKKELTEKEDLCRLSDIGFEVYKKLFPQPKDPQKE